MKIKGKKIFKNGAIGAYVYYKTEDKWKWRIISGPKKQNGGITVNNYKKSQHLLI
tara:strand:- start:25 stop:189 length:165 start_codon:yes stop_codon:yes gene_type:complete